MFSLILFKIFAHFYCICFTFFHIPYCVFSSGFYMWCFQYGLHFCSGLFFYSTFSLNSTRSCFVTFWRLPSSFSCFYISALSSYFATVFPYYTFWCHVNIFDHGFQLLCGSVFLVTGFCPLFVFLSLFSIHISLVLITFDNCSSLNEGVPLGPTVYRRFRNCSKLARNPPHSLWSSFWQKVVVNEFSSFFF